MGNIGWTGIIIVAVLVVLLFGRGKISSIMGDVDKGIKSFKRGMAFCEGQGLIEKNIACKADFSLILPEEIKKYNLKK